MEKNKVTTIDIKEQLLKYGMNIQKLYDELFKLSIHGKMNSHEYNKIKEDISLYHEAESRIYKRIFNDEELLVNFNNDVIFKINTEELIYTDIATMIFREPEKLVLYRISREFERRLVASEYLDYFIPSSVSTNEYVFHIFQNNLHFKNTANLLVDKMKHILPVGREYFILSKHYHGLTFSCFSIEEDFLDNYRTTYTVADFLEKHPNLVEKDYYITTNLDDINDLNWSYIKTFFNEYTPDDRSIIDVMSLYTILIESTFNKVPNQYAVDILAQINNILAVMDFTIADDGNTCTKKNLLKKELNKIGQKYIKKKEA